MAVWTGDLARLRRVTAQYDRVSGPGIGNVRIVARMYRGEIDDKELETEWAAQQDDNPRFVALLWQMVCEAACLYGRDDEAIEYLRRSSASDLVDLDWLERCPSLARLRDREEFEEVSNEVSRRAHAVWVR